MFMNITNQTAQLIEYAISGLAVMFLVMLLLDSLAGLIIETLGATAKGGKDVD